MIIAIPLHNNLIADYLKDSTTFKFYQVENHKIVDVEIVDVSTLPLARKCQLLNIKRVHTLLAGKIIALVRDLLDRYNIRYVTGAIGDPDISIDLLIKNRDLMLEEYLESEDENQQINCDETGVCNSVEID